MKIDSQIKFINNKVVSVNDKITINFTDELSIPSIINGIYNKTEVDVICRSFSNPLIINCLKVKHYEIYDMLKNDTALSQYNCIVLLNFHSINVISDLIIGSLNYIQKLRSQNSVKPIKLVLFTFPKYVYSLSSLFDSCVIYNMAYNANENVLCPELDCDNFNKYRSIVSMIFEGKLPKDVYTGSLDQLKVIFYLPDHQTCMALYTWLNRNTSVTYVWIYSENNDVTIPSKYNSCLVLTYSIDCDVSQELNIDFDIVINSGLICKMKYSNISQTNLKTIQQIDLTDYLVRYKSEINKKTSALIQLNSNESFRENFDEKNQHFKVHEDITDFIFRLLCLGDSFVANFQPKFLYLMAPLSAAINNLVKSNLAEKLAITNNKSNRLSACLASLKLTERAKSIQGVQLDCRIANVILYSSANTSNLITITLVALLENSSHMFCNKFVANNIERPSIKSYDDFSFLIELFREFAALSKSQRNAYAKKYGLCKKSMVSTSKSRSIIKSWTEEHNLLRHNNDGGGGLSLSREEQLQLTVESFVRAFPNQLAKYCPTNQHYYRIGTRYDSNNPTTVSRAMKIDPHSLILLGKEKLSSDCLNSNDMDIELPVQHLDKIQASANVESMPQHIFYYSTYKSSLEMTEASTCVIYMQYVCEISRELYEEMLLLADK